MVEGVSMPINKNNKSKNKLLYGTIDNPNSNGLEPDATHYKVSAAKAKPKTQEEEDIESLLAEYPIHLRPFIGVVLRGSDPQNALMYTKPEYTQFYLNTYNSLVSSGAIDPISKRPYVEKDISQDPMYYFQYLWAPKQQDPPIAQAMYSVAQYRDGFKKRNIGVKPRQEFNLPRVYMPFHLLSENTEIGLTSWQGRPALVKKFTDDFFKACADLPNTPRDPAYWSMLMAVLSSAPLSLDKVTPSVAGAFIKMGMDFAEQCRSHAQRNFQTVLVNFAPNYGGLYEAFDAYERTGLIAANPDAATRNLSRVAASHDEIRDTMQVIDPANVIQIDRMMLPTEVAQDVIRANPNVIGMVMEDIADRYGAEDFIAAFDRLYSRYKDIYTPSHALKMKYGQTAIDILDSRGTGQDFNVVRQAREYIVGKGYDDAEYIRPLQKRLSQIMSAAVSEIPEDKTFEQYAQRLEAFHDREHLDIPEQLENRINVFRAIQYVMQAGYAAAANGSSYYAKSVQPNERERANMDPRVPEELRDKWGAHRPKAFAFPPEFWYAFAETLVEALNGKFGDQYINTFDDVLHMDPRGAFGIRAYINLVAKQLAPFGVTTGDVVDVFNEILNAEHIPTTIPKSETDVVPVGGDRPEKFDPDSFLSGLLDDVEESGVDDLFESSGFEGKAGEELRRKMYNVLFGGFTKPSEMNMDALVEFLREHAAPVGFGAVHPHTTAHHRITDWFLSTYTPYSTEEAGEPEPFTVNGRVVPRTQDNIVKVFRAWAREHNIPAYVYPYVEAELLDTAVDMRAMGSDKVAGDPMFSGARYRGFREPRFPAGSKDYGWRAPWSVMRGNQWMNAEEPLHPNAAPSGVGSATTNTSYGGGSSLGQSGDTIDAAIKGIIDKFHREVGPEAARSERHMVERESRIPINLYREWMEYAVPAMQGVLNRFGTDATRFETPLEMAEYYAVCPRNSGKWQVGDLTMMVDPNENYYSAEGTRYVKHGRPMPPLSTGQGYDRFAGFEADVLDNETFYNVYRNLLMDRRRHVNKHRRYMFDSPEMMAAWLYLGDNERFNTWSGTLSWVKSILSNKTPMEAEPVDAVPQAEPQPTGNFLDSLL
jgi:hypothetical protein